MGISMKYIKQILSLLTAVTLYILLAGTVHAQGGAITMYPNSGSYAVGQTFTITVKLDGGGFPFNAAKASVLVSPALSVQNVTIGDCGFAFVKPPVQTDPSFVGVILGGSAKNCSLYTLTVKAISEGKGTITFVNSSIKSYKSAVDILTSLQNGTFTVTPPTPGTKTTPVTPVPIEEPTTGTNGVKLYDIVFGISQPQDIPLAGVYVVLDPDTSAQQTAIPSLISGLLAPGSISGSVKFANVTQGVHTIATYYNSRVLTKQVIYVSGNTKTLVFGISTKRSSISWQMIVMLAAILILLIIILMIVYKLLHKSHGRKSEPQEPMFRPITQPQQ